MPVKEKTLEYESLVWVLMCNRKPLHLLDLLCCEVFVFVTEGPVAACQHFPILGPWASGLHAFVRSFFFLSAFVHLFYIISQLIFSRTWRQIVPFKSAEVNSGSHTPPVH